MATNQNTEATRSEETRTSDRLAAAFVRLNLFRIGDDLYAHWTSEDHAILAKPGANAMHWMHELAEHEARHGR